MRKTHKILLLAFLLPMLSIFGASNIKTMPMSGKAKLDSIIRSAGYAAFNLYSYVFNGIGCVTKVGLLVLRTDSSYICKRSLFEDTNYVYENIWAMSGDTLILLEDNYEYFVDNNQRPLTDSELCSSDFLSDTNMYSGKEFGRIVPREYEKGHATQWRDRLCCIIGEDSIGIFIKPVDYTHGPLNVITDLGRHVSIPYGYIDDFIPYVYTGPYKLFNSPFQMLRFPHLINRYGIDRDSLYNNYKKAMMFYPVEYENWYLRRQEYMKMRVRDKR